MKIFLDDQRETPAGWQRTYTVKDTIMLLQAGVVETVSLDHDLGEGQEDGYEVLRWIEEKAYFYPDWKIPEIFIHSDNGPGRDRMRSALLSINRIKQAREQE